MAKKKETKQPTQALCLSCKHYEDNICTLYRLKVITPASCCVAYAKK